MLGEYCKARTTCPLFSPILHETCIQTQAEPYQLLLDLVRKSSFTSFQLPDADVEDDTLLRTLLRRRCSERSDGSTSLTTASALVPGGRESSVNRLPARTRTFRRARSTPEAGQAREDVRIFPAPPIPKDRLRSSRLSRVVCLTFMACGDIDGPFNWGQLGYENQRFNPLRCLTPR